jgi:hypothetical protein
MNQITVAMRSEAWNLFARSKTGIVGSNSTRDMDVCVRCLCVCVILCVGSGLATGWSLIQQVPLYVCKIHSSGFILNGNEPEGLTRKAEGEEGLEDWRKPQRNLKVVRDPAEIRTREFFEQKSKALRREPTCSLSKGKGSAGWPVPVVSNKKWRLLEIIFTDIAFS